MWGQKIINAENGKTMSTLYVLVDRKPVSVPDVYTWGAWFEDAKNRHVAITKIGDDTVSTVFLGMDHGFDEKKPVLFETMIFGGKYDDYQERFCTWDEAERGHVRAVELVLKENGKDF